MRDVFSRIANVAFIRKGITEIVFQFMIIEGAKQWNTNTSQWDLSYHDY